VREQGREWEVNGEGKKGKGKGVGKGKGDKRRRQIGGIKGKGEG